MMASPPMMAEADVDAFAGKDYHLASIGSGADVIRHRCGVQELPAMTPC